MILWQYIFVVCFGLLNVLAFFRAWHELRNKDNVFGLTRYLFFLGEFVWGDVILISFWWAAVSVLILVVGDWNLFLLIQSVFWIIRSVGEMIYWLNQQFSPINRNPVHSLLGNSIFKKDSIWFAYQVAWQCVFVVAVILSLYFSKIWLSTI